MTNGTSMLVLLVIVMLVGSYVAGMIPLVMKLSETKLNFVTVLGAGLLVGTALTVIIPEGIRALYVDMVKPQPTEVKTPPVPPSSDNLNHPDGSDFSQTIGLSLVLGFIFMLLVDQISQRKSKSNITATLGLVVHAAADGVALGAAAATAHQDVEIVVFLAIMIHKAPAAFGLVSFLLHEKIDHQQIRKHLLIFSISAPLLTLLTYFGIGQEQKNTLNSLNATGIAMLFSAGTFLYVATVHVLPELSHKSHSYDLQNYHQLDTNDCDIESKVDLRSTARHSKGLTYIELVLLICGSLLPVLTIGHHH
ncbi:zinc transporter ZIP9 [Eurosta solidaginis]|uniref:zinc transporter ZIP9 n=1 Tax=Eurosta solidaginis TaxID=178769 RepID=UPI00353080F2